MHLQHCWIVGWIAEVKSLIAFLIVFSFIAGCATHNQSKLQSHHDTTQGSVQPLGAGTEVDPYQISRLGHLAWMAENVSSSCGKYYTMQNDIDASATVGWNSGTGSSPIGEDQNRPFKGIFNGNRKVISNLTINLPSRTYFVGLFELVLDGGVVKDIGLAGGSVTGNDYVGSLVGWNCGTVSGCYATGPVTGNNCVGGLIGAGWLDDSAGMMNSCFATGRVTGDNQVGGLVGANCGIGTVSGCYATGPVTGRCEVGGLAGNNTGNATVSNCFTTGSVMGRR